MLPAFNPKQQAQLTQDALFDVEQYEIARGEWHGMPEFNSVDKFPHRTVYVHFTCDDDAQVFARLVGQKITAETKYIWFPKQEIKRVAHLRYQSDES